MAVVRGSKCLVSTPTFRIEAGSSIATQFFYTKIFSHKFSHIAISINCHGPKRPAGGSSTLDISLDPRLPHRRRMLGSNYTIHAKSCLVNNFPLPPSFLQPPIHPHTYSPTPTETTRPPLAPHPPRPPGCATSCSRPGTPSSACSLVPHTRSRCYSM